MTDIDSNPTGLLTARRGFVYTDSGGNALISTRRGGRAIAIFEPVPSTQPVRLRPPGRIPADAVPTDVVVGPDGARYVSQLVGFPFEPGASTIWRVPRGGDPEPYATGLTNVTSLAFAKDGTLYAVEIAANGLLARPGRCAGQGETGRLHASGGRWQAARTVRSRDPPRLGLRDHRHLHPGRRECGQDPPLIG